MANLHVNASSQGCHRAEDSAAERTMGRVISARGYFVEWHHREPRGIAGQRHFLLGRAAGSDAVLLLDDVFVEPLVVERLHSVLESYSCGIVGPDQQDIELWPSTYSPGSSSGTHERPPVPP